MVYALLEPLVHKYVKDLRTPESMSEGALGPLKNVLVFMKVLSKERAQASQTRCQRHMVKWTVSEGQRLQTRTSYPLFVYKVQCFTSWCGSLNPMLVLVRVQ